MIGRALHRRVRLKDGVRLSVLLALIALVVVVEMTSGGVQEWYRNHSLQSGIVTGVLLSFVAYFGFDAVRASLNEARWGPLSALAFLSLAYQTTIVIDVLLWLVTGIAPVNDAKPARRRQAQLRLLRRRAGVPRPRHDDLGRVEHDDYAGSLRRLLADDRWVGFALTELDRWKRRNREGIASWAAPMLTTGEAAAVLNRLALLNESLSVLQSWLRRLVDPGGDDRVALVGRSACVWLDVHAEAVSVREDLVRAARGLAPSWEEFRRALPPARRRELEERHRRSGGATAARRTLIRPLAEVPAPPRPTSC